MSLVTGVRMQCNYAKYKEFGTTKKEREAKLDRYGLNRYCCHPQKKQFRTGCHPQTHQCSELCHFLELASSGLYQYLGVASSGLYQYLGVASSGLCNFSGFLDIGKLGGGTIHCVKNH